LGFVGTELEEFYTTYYNFTKFEIPNFYNNSYTSHCKTLDPTVIVGHLVLHTVLISIKNWLPDVGLCTGRYMLQNAGSKKCLGSAGYIYLIMTCIFILLWQIAIKEL